MRKIRRKFQRFISYDLAEMCTNSYPFQFCGFTRNNSIIRYHHHTEVTFCIRVNSHRKVKNVVGIQSYHLLKKNTSLGFKMTFWNRRQETEPSFYLHGLFNKIGRIPNFLELNGPILKRFLHCLNIDLF